MMAESGPEKRDIGVEAAQLGLQKGWLMSCGDFDLLRAMVCM
jgi:hypothetical protein